MKILFINPFGIGDCLFTLPVARAIKKNCPKSSIVYWCNERLGSFLSSQRPIDKVIAKSRGDIKRLNKSSIARFWQTLGLFLVIKKERFDIAFDFSLDPYYSYLCKIAGIRRRLGFDYKNRGKFLTEKFKFSGYNDSHVIDYYLSLLSFLKISPDPGQEKLCLEEGVDSWAEEFMDKRKLSPAGLVAISPGGGESWGSDACYKHWPAEKFARVCSDLIKSAGVTILIFGSSKEQDVCDRVFNFIENKDKVIRCYPDLTLQQFAGLLSKCRLLIANDSGPLHMAVALDIATVSIFGPVNEKVYGPYPASEKHKVIKSNVECRPCYKNFRFNGCQHDRICLETIDPQRVLQEAQSLLK